MPISITSESYNLQPSLNANAGDYVEAQTTFSLRFSIGSGYSNKMTYHTLGSVHTLEIQSGDMGDQGFVVGDVITIIWKQLNFPLPFQNQTNVRTITYVSGNSIRIDSQLTLTPALTTVPDGRVFPTENVTNGMLILADKPPSSADFLFNLTPDGSSSFNSVLDSELNRFELQDVAGLGAGVPTAMTQLGNKSGGYFKDVKLTFVGTAGSGWRDYKIDYKFLQWGMVKDGFTEPNYYDLGDTLAPIVRVKGFAIYGNPNGVLTATSTNTEANVGGFDENYNGGVNNYAKIDMNFADSLGNPISAPDNSGPSTFEGTISALNQNNPLSTYQIGMVWRPEDGTQYQNLPTSMGENLLLNAPENNFIADGVVDPTLWTGEENTSGARWDISDVRFEISGATVIISGKLTPSAATTAFFDLFPDGGRKTTIWVSISNHTLVAPFIDRVSLKMFDDDNIEAPTIGVQIPDVVDVKLLDHAMQDITLPLPQTTTEDDVLFRSTFKLIDGLDYEGIRARIYAKNTVTGDEFDLEPQVFFSFTGVVNIAGQFQPNIFINRGFNLPPLSDRNQVSLIRKPSLDGGGKYGLQLEYGYLSLWQYWLQLSNVNNDFFDITQFHDGKNKDWQRFSNSGDWIVKLSYYTRLDGVDDFQDQEIGIRPYEDDADVTTVWSVFVPSSGATPTDLVGGEINEVTATLTWATGTYTNPWAEVTIEDFESGDRWVISTVLEQGGIVNNPLKPITGQTFLDMQFPSANVAKLKLNVDATVIDVAKVCMSARIYSVDQPLPSPYLINTLKDADFAISVRRVADPSIYPLGSPCMRIRRSSDDAELDIGFSGDNLDLTAITTFVGGSDAFVTRWYNQNGTGAADAIQTTMSKQPQLVFAGTVNLASNGFPAPKFDGSNHWMALQIPLGVDQSFYESFVFDRLGTAGAGITNSLGNSTIALPFSFIWDFGNNMISGMTDSGNILHAAAQTQTGGFNITTKRDPSNDCSMYRNSVLVSTVNYSKGFATVLNSLGFSAQLGGDLLMIGNVQEEIFYRKDKTADQSFIETNTNDYYSNY